MNCGLHAAIPPGRPLLVFDGDCHFCTLWIRRWQQLTGDAVDYLPSQDPRIAERFPEIPAADFAKAVQYVGADGVVCSGAAAVFRALAHNSRWRWPLQIYEASPLFARVTERAYRVVAEHRPVFSMLTRWGWGRQVEVPSYFLARWLFLRALGVVYLVAFLSLWSQIHGLIGHNGILPVEQYLPAVAHYCDAQGIGLDRYRLWPTLCWFDASDGFLDFQCAAGTVLAVVLIIGIAPAPCLFLLWLLYLSLVVVGREFLGFQWDNLLLEAGLLSVFLAPLRMLPTWYKGTTSPRPSTPFGMAESEKKVAAKDFDRAEAMGAVAKNEAPPSRLFVWLLRLLLFKLMFSSGCVKLLSGDPAWRRLTALTFHYQTQPLPPWTAWYAQQLPEWFQKFSCAVLFGIELGAPFLIFAPRRLRFIGATLLVGLQMLIMLTGNYTFFNWLTLALCLLLLDDFALMRAIPNKLRSWCAGTAGGDSGEHARPGRGWTRPRVQHSDGVNQDEGGGVLGAHEVFREGAENSARGGRAPRHWPRPVLIVVAVVLLTVSGLKLVETLGFRPGWLAPVGWVAAGVEPFRSVNGYGLFAVMTTQRNEIIIEGSNDGVKWVPYEFKYKPGDVLARPRFVAPFQPRLDWQMWFASLGSPRQNPWLVTFCERLLQRSPEVLGLLAGNPFPEHPPRFIRAEFYDYRFTSFAERRATGAWWQRTLVGEYLPPVSLKE